MTPIRSARSARPTASKDRNCGQDQPFNSKLFSRPASLAGGVLSRRRDIRARQTVMTQEANDTAKDGGHLRKYQQRELNHEENRESRRIYDDKH